MITKRRVLIGLLFLLAGAVANVAVANLADGFCVPMMKGRGST